MIATDFWNWLNQTIPTPLWFWFILALWVFCGLPRFELEDYKRYFHSLRSIPNRLLRRVNRIPMPRRKP